MPWEKTKHECQRPIAGRRGLGSVWRCRRCGTRWELTAKRHTGVIEHTRWREMPKTPPSISQELAEHGDPGS